MKKCVVLSLVAMITMGISFGQISKKQADNIISKYIENELSTDYLLYYYGDTNSNKVKIITWWDTMVRQNSYTYFIDEMPMANWCHPCRYVFIDKAEGNIETILTQTPPIESEFVPMFEKSTIEQKEMQNASNMFRVPQHRAASRLSKLHKKYAIILSGGGSKTSNYLRYWNDCSFIYKVLVNVYGFLPNNIYVLMSDGTDPSEDRCLPNGNYDSSPLDLDGNGTNDIQYSATKQNITIVFDALAKKITSEDDLFIFTTDHGARSNNQSSLVLWNNVRLYPAEFAKEVNKIKARNISIVMEQCYSGGFILALDGPNRVIMTACKENEVSYACSSVYYDKFVYHWTSAMARKYPNNTKANADNNSDGFISMEEAFRFAQDKDKKVETPQYHSNASNLGQLVTLRELTCSKELNDEIVTTNKSVEGCEIIVNDITIESTGKLTLTYDDVIIINASFEMKEGAELTIEHQ